MPHCNKVNELALLRFLYEMQTKKRNSKSNLHYASDIATKRMTNEMGPISTAKRLCNKISNFEQTSRPSRALGNTRSDLTFPETESQTSCTIGDVVTSTSSKIRNWSQIILEYRPTYGILFVCPDMEIRKVIRQLCLQF